MVAWPLVVKVLRGLALVIVLLAVGAVLLLAVSASTPPLRDAGGVVLPGSIAVLERLELGGLEQWITIRGADVTNPVLLWLHGGPGSPQMPLAHHLDTRLEQALVVVHWDQRGAGKSTPEASTSPPCASSATSTTPWSCSRTCTAASGTSAWAYGGNFDVPITRLAGIVARAPAYAVGDDPRLLRGMNRGGGARPRR